jgi:hypothetical protein
MAYECCLPCMLAMDVALGPPTKDLGPRVRQHMWMMQPQPTMVLVSDSTKYMWMLRCRKHLRMMTVQAAFRQLNDPKHLAQLAPCERCTSSYKLGPQPLPDEKHRSYWEQVAWLQLESVLMLDGVQHHMSAISHLHGCDLGYVVEARMVKGWPAGVDIYVPALDLILQVDGQHHDDKAQQVRDSRFNALAACQGHRVLRLYYLDVHTFFNDIRCAVGKCMQQGTGDSWLHCTRHHPLANSPNEL